MPFDAFNGIAVMILDQKPRLGTRKKVQARVMLNICLKCDEPATRRGLCACCYSRYRTAQFELAPSERPAHEARMIRAGNLLPSRQGQKTRSKNPFRQKGA